MSTPAELSAKLRAPSLRTQFNSAGELQTHEVYPSPYDIEIADALDALQAQVEVLRVAMWKLANECDGLRAFEDELRDAIGNTNWNVLRLRVDEARAALSPIKASDADRREVKT